MSKNNVHPDHYKTAGRDRQDDAAAARQARAVAAKTSSQQRPDRMAKGPYFQRPEPAPAPKTFVTQSKKEVSAPRTRPRPTASSKRAIGRSAKKNATAAATRRPAKKR
jgi:hypothetical protein